MDVVISRERPDSTDARALIAELDASLAPNYPSASRHGYSVDKLIAQNVAFFVVRVDSHPAGCGGVQLFGTTYAELKRMYVRPPFRGLGLAKQLLDHLQAYAQAQEITVLRLETGIYQHEAIALYEKFGFHQIAPFGEYKPDPLSRCYEKRIANSVRST